VSRFLSMHLAVNHTPCLRAGARVGVHHHSVYCLFTFGPSLHSMVLQEFKRKQN